MKAHAVVLGAGAGRRFGGGKLLATYDGRPLVAWAVEAALRSPVNAVTVVVAPGGEAITQAARAAAAAYGEEHRLSVTVAHDAEEGMGASLRAGVAAAPADAAVVVFLGDMPRIDAAVVKRLLAALEGGSLAATPVLGERRGHPAVFAPALREQLLKVGGDAGARDVLAGLGERLVLVPVDDEGVLFDVDTREDLAGSGADVSRGS